MQRNPLVTIFDIETAIKGVMEATDGKTFAEFQADWLLRHGVQRGIEIVSEASRRLPQNLLDHHPDIQWHRIRAVGNVLRHEYQRVSDEIIWKVVEHDLPALTHVMASMREILETDRSP